MNLDGSGNPVPNASQGDLFSYRLDYETAYIYDGNIGKQSWQASNNNTPSGLRAYTFTYDNISHLKSATYAGVGSENYSLPTINYDRNGNITSMQRNGKLSSTTYGPMDNLTYTYSGNRLTKVEDAVSGNYDVDFVNRNNGTDDYSYYANGALKADKNEEITDIIYSTYANQPIEIQLSGSRWIKNFYDGAGRLYKTSYSTGEYWEYLDGMVFKNGAFYQLTTPEGRANYQSGAWDYEYFLTDHLGNTRVAYKANGTALTKTSETAFDPWGIVLKDVGLVNAFQNKFEYQNKEKESTFNLRRISFGARTYNASIGRFDGVDPLAAKYSHLSSYAYVGNNPVNAIDPNGRLIILVNGHWNKIANWLGMSPGAPKEAYWNYFDRDFIGAAKSFFKDDKATYVDGSSRMGFDQSGGDRFRRGQKWAKKNYESVMAGLADGETIKLIGHSEGSAYAAGIADYFIKRAKKDGKGSVIESMLHLSPDEADEFDNPKEPTTYRIHDLLDPVSPAFYYLSGVDYEMITAGYKKIGYDDISQSHGRTVTRWAINQLQGALNQFMQDPNVQMTTNADGSTTYKRTGQ